MSFLRNLMPVAMANLLILPFGALAAESGGVSLGQTRVVFLSTDKAQTLTVKNTGSQTFLIQSRVQRSPDDTAPAPFIVTPPLFPLKSDSRQLLRIVSQEASLPTDRESLFYITILAIPAKADKENAPVQLSMGVRFMLKLFYRPAGLVMNPEEKACSLRISRTPQGIRIDNPTPYFQTLAKLSLNRVAVNLNTEPDMLAPLSAQTYSSAGAVTSAEWQTITDYGGLSVQCQQTVSSIQETL